MTILRPAYGRDYTSAADAADAFAAGRDFILCDITSPWYGKPCNIRDFAAGSPITIRYAGTRRPTVFHWPVKDEPAAPSSDQAPSEQQP
jgi:hypothetical protein